MLKKKQTEGMVLIVVLLTIATHAVLAAAIIAGGLILCKHWIK